MLAHSELSDLIRHLDALSQNNEISFKYEHNNVVACYDVNGLITALTLEYKSQNWRLFID
ncbi:hypothetical protein PR048_022359 [Dryococelus australis]|uniref:Uncharacterized protein n=1 Tax=Dryococelus australis TaxID=614101 RepID=A0ABQ9H0W1_9NEOP|nr:hypothetical protein PR048_022359 [Dryococelus australis]